MGEKGWGDSAATSGKGTSDNRLAAAAAALALAAACEAALADRTWRLGRGMIDDSIYDYRSRTGSFNNKRYGKLRRELWKYIKRQMSERIIPGHQNDVNS